MRAAVAMRPVATIVVATRFFSDENGYWRHRAGITGQMSLLPRAVVSRWSRKSEAVVEPLV